MMEEASDEQPEMVTHEEAMQAEIEATANIPPSLAGKKILNIVLDN